MVQVSEFRNGKQVRVKSLADIQSTLDADGMLDNMPFMPEMAELCGQQLTVESSSHKTCDTVSKTGNRYVEDTVHLRGARCSGSEHGGCDAQCLLYWKGAWLEHVTPNSASTGNTKEAGAYISELIELTQKSDEHDEIRYICQATELPNFSTLAKWWDVRQYLMDLNTKNVTFSRIATNMLSRALEWTMSTGVAYTAVQTVYVKLMKLLKLPIMRAESGVVPKGTKTPTVELGLQPGDVVQIRSYEEILDTMDGNNKNRGMRFDPEMAPFCGGRFTVRRRVEKILNEQTGYMIHMKTPAVVLDGVICESRFSSDRLFCPRALPSFWREAWLTRPEPDVVKVIDQ